MEVPKIHSKSKHRRHSSRRITNGHLSDAEKENELPSVSGVVGENNNDGENGDVRGEENDIDVASASNPQPEIRHDDSVEIAPTETDEKLQKGILGYMDCQLKVQNVNEAPRSPAQRSTRSRSSNEKSPRRKRSKSESRRRRERKIIAAGEMEVRQANETLMRYLKQCSDFNDASLSGDLEIDENMEDRRVHRKTKAERQKRSHLHSNKNGKSNPSDLTTVLNDLADDVRHSGGNSEIYNPFTPVISPLEGPGSRIDKVYIQTSSGYRPVDNNNSFYKSPLNLGSYENRQITCGVHLSCFVQRIWILLANICHGLLAGLGVAHLLLIFSTRPLEWIEGTSLRDFADFVSIYASVFYCLAIICMVSVFDRMDISRMDLPIASESIQFRWIVIFLIYAVTTTLSLCCGPTDERLYYLTTQNTTILTEDLESNNNILSIWNSLSVARSFGAIMGWILIGFSPNTDKLYAYLLDMEKYLTN